MNRKFPLLAAALVTLAAFAAWLATDRHAYTKFEVVERVEVPVAAGDPLAAAGFYEDGKNVQTVRRPEFHLGLLPTPQRLLDKHIVSVLTIAAPAWMVTAVLLWPRRRRA